MLSKRSGKADPLEPERHQRARVEVSSSHSRDRGSTMNITTYGLDLAKRAEPHYELATSLPDSLGRIFGWTPAAHCPRGMRQLSKCGTLKGSSA
jgi:hypothetical protein